MIDSILKKVKSPFTDELITNLIDLYISCGCDDNVFYNRVNNLDISQNENTLYTRDLINQIHSIGKVLESAPRDNSENGIFYENREMWTVLYSNYKPIKDERTGDNKRPLLYRFYINLKGQDKKDLVLKYMEECQKENIPFELKFSNDESRDDQIIIMTSLDNFEKNFSILEKLTSDKELGKLPMLIGQHDNGIGIAEEYYNRLYSPTKARLALIRASVKKYLCDHIDEFESQLSDEERKKINEYIDDFNYLYESEKEDIEELGDEYEDLRKAYYQEKSTIDCAKEHIENDHYAYICGDGLLELGNAISQIYSNNTQEFISEVIKNFRTIGTQVWGFSEDFIFSNETEKRFMTTKHSEMTDLQKREQELVSLESEEKIITDAETLINIKTSKEGPDIGEN